MILKSLLVFLVVAFAETANGICARAIFEPPPGQPTGAYRLSAQRMPDYSSHHVVDAAVDPLGAVIVALGFGGDPGVDQGGGSGALAAALNQAGASRFLTEL